MPIPADVISTLLAPMADDTRPFITTAQVRAADLRSDDIADLRLSEEKPRWRVVFDVCRDPGDVLVDLDEVTSDEVAEEAGVINLTAEPRPAGDPLLIISGDTDYNSRNRLQRVHPQVLVHALLGTGKYVAVRYVREETDDGSQVEHGWMIAPWWHPVTIQVESTAKENA